MKAWGIGGLNYETGEWFSISYDQLPALRNLHIAQLEFLALLTASELWIHRTRTGLVVCHVDNTNVEACIRHQNPKARSFMPYCRHMVRSELASGVRLYAKYCNTKLMVADPLSRANDPRWSEKFPSSASIIHEAIQFCVVFLE